MGSGDGTGLRRRARHLFAGRPAAVAGATGAHAPFFSISTMRQAAVLEMKAAGMSYAEIGRLLDLHRNRIQQIAEGRAQ
jgi:hypothetical protein